MAARERPATVPRPQPSPPPSRASASFVTYISPLLAVASAVFHVHARAARLPNVPPSAPRSVTSQVTFGELYIAPPLDPELALAARRARAGRALQWWLGIKKTENISRSTFLAICLASGVFLSISDYTHGPGGKSADVGGRSADGGKSADGGRSADRHKATRVTDRAALGSACDSGCPRRLPRSGKQ